MVGNVQKRTRYGLVVYGLWYGVARSERQKENAERLRTLRYASSFNCQFPIRSGFNQA
jgi:hypothetical protein